MDSHARENVARFLAASQPIEGGWTEKRLAFMLGGNMYLIENNIPGWDRHNPNAKPEGLGWTTTQILEWLDTQGIEPFEIEVEVKVT
jgi:hypothetical protein